ncbi:2,3-dihydroxybenzoate-AMP ligase [Streptomyces thermolilacinus SPC6]|uniref:2,3-dihydroxybenzoate-AMP ligase n=1 Tax=Streptomyces thermolilacinus SPC6 TaxID=1306406 RepID=A0A1D3DZV5_9ACTN|nr:2,3-dihydroxybenzoate-AMP ligase [Streptomyces thermolilacinus SPC6]
MGIADELLRGEARLRADLGLDSVDLSQLALELAERYGVRFDPWSGHDHTVREVVALARTGQAGPVAERYRGRGWWAPELLDEAVLDTRGHPGGRAALTGDGRTLRRAALDAAVSGCAARLAEGGVLPGDHVLVLPPNEPRFLVLVLALIRLGACPVLAPPTLRARELGPVVSAVGATAMAVPGPGRRFDHLRMAEGLRLRHPSLRTLIVPGGDAARGRLDLDACAGLHDTAPVDAGRGAAPVGGARRPSDTALFLLSSGTTGAPRLIPRSHEAFTHVVRASAGVSGMGRDTVYLAALPVAHSFAFGHPGVLGALVCGGRAVLGPDGDPGGALELIERERVTHCALTPAVARQWLGARAARPGHDLSSLRVIQVGGARLDEDTAARLAEVFACRVQQVYGMSEGLLNLTRLDDPPGPVATTQGRPASPGDETRVVDGAGRPVADGETGELLVRGPGVITAYHGGAEPEAFTPDGFLRTGDLVRRHPSGNFQVVGRVKDVINRGGEKIPAGELESLVLAHPRVRSAAAVAMPHPVLGEAVCLYVTGGAEGAPSLREIRRFLVEAGLAPFKLPEHLVELPALPLTGIGKIDKVRLREDVRARTAPSAPPPR